MKPVVAFMNLKGGVGKTTLAGNTARALADVEKQKILLMDLDSQCNLTQLFCSADEIDRRAERSVYQCFESKQFLKQPPYPSDLKVGLYSSPTGGQVDIIFGSYETFRLAITAPGKLVPKAAAQHFGDFMQRARAEYDLIILDTNPSASFTTLCALDVANFLVAPITMDLFSLRGIHLIKQVLSDRYTWLGNPKRIRIFPNRIRRARSDAETEMMERHEQEIRSRFPRLDSSIMTNRIHESRLLFQRAPGGGFIADRQIYAIHRRAKSKVCEDFEQAARELSLSLKEAFGDARYDGEANLRALRRRFKEDGDGPVVRH